MDYRSIYDYHHFKFRISTSHQCTSIVSLVIRRPGQEYHQNLGGILLFQCPFLLVFYLQPSCGLETPQTSATFFVQNTTRYIMTSLSIDNILDIFLFNIVSQVFLQTLKLPKIKLLFRKRMLLGPCFDRSVNFYFSWILVLSRGFPSMTVYLLFVITDLVMNSMCSCVLRVSMHKYSMFIQQTPQRQTKQREKMKNE